MQLVLKHVIKFIRSFGLANTESGTLHDSKNLSYARKILNHKHLRNLSI